MSDELRTAIQQGDADESLRTAHHLAEAGELEPLVEALLDLLASDSAWVRGGTIELLRTFAPPVELLTRLRQELDAVLAEAHLLYPDPWPKTRHHKRRFVSPTTVGELAPSNDIDSAILSARRPVTSKRSCTRSATITTTRPAPSSGSARRKAPTMSAARCWRSAPEQMAIAHEVATQLAIAITQAMLRERLGRQAEELERRVAERTAALDEANRELEDLYGNAPCGYHSVDEDGVIVRANDTWLAWLGRTREEVVGRMSHPELMTPESAERFRAEVFPRFKRQGWLKAEEFEYRRKDGSTFVGSLNATTVCDAAGRYRMSRSTVFDVSERKRAEQALRALNEELEGFSYSVSHDLRAPLRAVDGFALMLEEDYAARLDAEGRRLLGVVRENAQRMGHLIDDFPADCPHHQTHFHCAK